MKTKDNLDEILRSLSEIIISERSNQDKASRMRSNMERAVKYALNIKREEYHAFRALNDALSDNINYRTLRLHTTGGILYTELSKIVHDEIIVVEDNKYQSLLDRYKKYLEVLFDIKNISERLAEIVGVPPKDDPVLVLNDSIIEPAEPIFKAEKSVIIKLEEVKGQFLTEDGNYIKKRSKEKSLSEDKFYQALSEWQELNPDPKALIGNSNVGVSPLIYASVNGVLYRLHSDANGEGVSKFLSNKGNPLVNAEGRQSITNRKDKKPIRRFPLYKVD